MQPSETQKFDIIIAGGGMAGATAAIALAGLGLRIALAEAVEPALETSPSFDQRAVALSDASVSIYKSLGLWPQLSSISCAIKHISVSDAGNFGFTRLDAKDYQVDSLGEVIPLDLAGPILWHELSQQTNISVFCPAKVVSVKSAADTCEVLIQQSESEQLLRLESKLLLAADGTFSQIAEQLDIDVSREAYGQHAVIANIETQQAHQNRAYERFTSTGPLALLPLSNLPDDRRQKSEKRMSLVWCHAPEDVDKVMNWSDQEFSAELQKAFGYRLGKIEKIGVRSGYPLSLHLAQKSFTERVLLLGNAVHTVHPIGGQGFNLGLRDIAALIEQLELALAQNQDFGSQQFLENYAQTRQQDWQQTIVATDSFARLFSNQFFPLVMIRNKAMNILNRIPFVKRQLAVAAMGYGGRSSRLARGIKQSTKLQNKKA